MYFLSKVKKATTEKITVKFNYIKKYFQSSGDAVLETQA